MTVQAIELCKLSLAGNLAAKISSETGISARWLLEGDPDAPMMCDASFGDDRPYNREIFEMIQAMAKNPDRQRYLRHKKRDVRSLELCGQWFGVLAAARKGGKQEVAEYLLGQFIDSMKRRFGYEPAQKRAID
jgi:hypothetical protein